MDTRLPLSADDIQDAYQCMGGALEGLRHAIERGCLDPAAVQWSAVAWQR
ncbi:MAG: hypothetical protein ABR606_17945 [Vicinamibacterales bacterium]